jgi:hypothetical protein
MAPIAIQRLQLGGAAVLSPTRAAELLPGRETDAQRWLRDRGLVRHVDGLGEVVVWGDVLAAITAPSAAPVAAEPANGPRVGQTFRRAKL